MYFVISPRPSNFNSLLMFTHTARKMLMLCFVIGTAELIQVFLFVEMLSVCFLKSVQPFTFTFYQTNSSFRICKNAQVVFSNWCGRSCPDVAAVLCCVLLCSAVVLLCYTMLCCAAAVLCCCAVLCCAASVLLLLLLRHKPTIYPPETAAANGGIYRFHIIMISN